MRLSRSRVCGGRGEGSADLLVGWLGSRVSVLLNRRYDLNFPDLANWEVKADGSWPKLTLAVELWDPAATRSPGLYHQHVDTGFSRADAKLAAEPLSWVVSGTLQHANREDLA